VSGNAYVPRQIYGAAALDLCQGMLMFPGRYMEQLLLICVTE
jgi:hypothetical protein